MFNHPRRLKRTRCFVGFPVLLTAAFLFAQVPAIAGAPRGVVLRGAGFIDLKWDPADYPVPAGDQFLRWELRKGLSFDDADRPESVILSGTDRDRDFYRDAGLQPDTEYFYVLAIFRRDGSSGEPERSNLFFDREKTGPILGELYADLSLDAGQHVVSGLDITASATLRIEPGAVLDFVNPDSGSGDIEALGTADSPAGLEVNGATIKRLSLIYGNYGDLERAGRGWVRDSEIGLSVQVNGKSADIAVERNRFPADITALGQLTVRGASNATVIGNTGTFAVNISQGASATISQNDFIGSISVNGVGTTAEVLGNEIATELQGGGETGGLRAELNARVTARDNVITTPESSGLLFGVPKLGASFGAHLTAERNKFNGRARFEKDAEVMLRDNVFDRAQLIFDEGEVHGVVERNTIQNGRGILVTEDSARRDVMVRNNCIRGNNPGMDVRGTIGLRFEAPNNYWGASSGPFHSTLNPEGGGDVIFGDGALIDPFEVSDGNCRDSPPPPPPPASVSACVALEAEGRAARTSGASLTCHPTPKIIPNGEDTVAILAEVKDNGGQPLAGAVVNFTLPGPFGGRLLSTTCTTGSDGTCTVRFRAPSASQVFINGEGIDSIDVDAMVASVPVTRVTIALSYMNIVPNSIDPKRDARNVHWEELQLRAEADRDLDLSTIDPSRFRVTTERHPGAFQCVPSLDGKRSVGCRISWAGEEEKRLGYLITVEAVGGPDGIRGENGHMLQKSFSWIFYTLPALEPTILPVQVADLSRYVSPATLIRGKETVVRVHGGLSSDTELDYVEAKVDLTYGLGQNFPRPKVRFYPGELGEFTFAIFGEKNLLFAGNSANFYRATGRPDEVPILDDTGGGITAKIEPIDQQRNPQTPVYIAEAGAVVSVFGERNIEYDVIPLGLQQGAQPPYPWPPGQTVSLPELGFFSKDFVSRLFPVVRAIDHPRTRTIPVTAPWAPGTQITRAQLAAWTRALDSRAAALKPSGQKNLILVVPGEWLRSLNGGDPIHHRTGRYVCMLGSDAPAASVAHCLGHVKGLLDDVWFIPMMEDQRLGPDLRGYDLPRDRVVNNQFTQVLGPKYTFPLMSSDLGRRLRLRDDVWIDVDKYNKLIPAILRSSPLIGGGAGTDSEITVGGEIVRRSGGETGTIDVADFPGQTEAFPTPSGNSDYSIRLRGAGGTIVGEFGFVPEFSELEDRVEYASFLFNLPAATAPAEIELLRDGAIIDSLAGSATPPSVEVTQPTAGAYSGDLTIRWSSSDTDPDAVVRHSVYLSADGGETWEPIAIDIAGTSFAIDTTGQSSCQDCRIRVVVHDGFHRAEDESTTFAISNPPQVTEVFPPEGRTDVPRYTKVLARFRDPMDPSTLTRSTFRVADGGGVAVEGSVGDDSTGLNAVFSPFAAFAYGKTYTATLHRSISDPSGQELGEDVVWNFRIERNPAISPCTGDCNGDGNVRISELIRGVNIALGRQTVTECPAFDENADDTVSISELIRAVGHALRGCPSATPLPTPSPTTSPTVGTPTPTTPSSSPTVSTPSTPAPSASPTRTPPPHTATPTRTVGPGAITYCDALTAPFNIPDGDPFGIFNDIVIDRSDTIANLQVRLDITHTWVGDLTVSVTHLDTGTEVLLIDRPGKPAGEFGCGGDDIVCRIDDSAATACEDECADTTPTIGGDCRPAQPISQFFGQSMSGVWSVTVADSATQDSGALNSWCLDFIPAP